MSRPVVIPAGTVLYRFYDSHRAPTPQLGADGPWWIEFEYFQSIKHFADRHGYSLGYAARLFAAMSPARCTTASASATPRASAEASERSPGTSVGGVVMKTAAAFFGSRTRQVTA